MSEDTSKPSKGKCLSGLDLLSFLCVVALCVVYQDYMTLKQNMQIVQNELNNTPKADTSGLIFNRNPKAGSETIWALLDRLSKVNNFTSYSDSPDVKEARGSENTYMWRTGERHDYIKMLSVDSATNMSRPFSYVKHINFLDMSELNYTNPIYINFVRDPVDRVISWYYYIRQPHYLLKYKPELNDSVLHERRVNLKELKTPYELCVLNRYPECIFEKGQAVHTSFGTESRGGSHFSQIGFFCGMGPECNFFESEDALATAKRNVEKHYAVVGILEHMQASLEVLENYVPLYFKDARKVYKDMLQETHVNKNVFKPKTPRYIRDMLVSNFTREIEFYQFCKQRLLKQYLSIL